MANIPIRDIPGAVVASPDPSNLIPMDNGSLMQKTTIANAVNTAMPMASQSEAETGVDNVKRMSPLRTKQAIDAQTPGIVNTAITALNLGTMSQEEASDYTPTSGLAAVALSNDYNDLDNLPALGTMSQETASDYTKTSGLAAVALSNDYNDLDNLPPLGTAAATDASDYATSAQGALADTAVQPGDAQLVPSGGTIGQVLVKNSGTNYDTGWVSSAAATAVSYAPQTLTDAQAGQARANIGASLRGHLYGLTLSNNATDATNDIDIAPGEAASDGTTPALMTLSSAMTKRLDAVWAVGSGNGGLDTGTIANTTYHVFLIQRSDTGVVDALFSTSATAPTMPANYDRKRRIGSIIRSGGSIMLFYQNGDHFILSDTTIEYNSSSARALSAFTLAGVPAGIAVRPILTFRSLMLNTGDAITYVALNATSTVQLAARTQLAGASDNNTIDFLTTTTSREIYFQVAVLSGALSAVTVNSKGWIDSRGRIG